MSAADTRMITVLPASFKIVDFDPNQIATAVGFVADRVGLPTSEPIRVEIDEHSMLGQTRLTSVDPIVIFAHGGAFEDRSLPRRLSLDNVIDELARLLQRAMDRHAEAFSDAPREEDLTPQQRAAWDAHCLGRTAAWQERSFRERHRYDFKIACGFSQDATAAFDALWTTSHLGWEGIARLTPPPPARPAKATAAPRRR